MIKLVTGLGLTTLGGLALATAAPYLLKKPSKAEVERQIGRPITESEYQFALNDLENQKTTKLLVGIPAFGFGFFLLIGALKK